MTIKWKIVERNDGTFEVMKKEGFFSDWYKMFIYDDIKDAEQFIIKDRDNVQAEKIKEFLKKPKRTIKKYSL